MNKKSNKKLDGRNKASIALLISSIVFFSINPIKTHLLNTNLKENDSDKIKIITKSVKLKKDTKTENVSNNTTSISDNSAAASNSNNGKASKENNTTVASASKESNSSNTDNEKNSSNESINFEKVQSLNLDMVRAAKGKVDYSSAIGAISIPNIDLLLPIFKGLDNHYLSYGAGTLKSNQNMGQGNYTLAAHNYPDYPKILFSPLPKIKSNDRIYITDFGKIYEYKTEYIKLIEPTDIFVINDTHNKTELTLITCNNDGSKRYLVKASYIGQSSFTDNTSETKSIFRLN
ncbi:class A sortase [Peptostreptococcus sp. D1]|uniref:class A sortase n=1 Tax=Peptostreptococcus sp. D1 TaxID=72304 RepID=UPI0008EBAEDB|nr:class A sortase [Peptostreptococcus sp. D1]SFE63365.1 LPXTG-site transpeptidase (sortase) family protein [Peptostreptococcus sp. D1]